jgi:uncharacterized protein YdaU (DUF1376 family)
VNFYKHHIGDYAAATAHLSWDEDMAYSRLLRWYYQHEKPLPADQRALYRLTRAQSKQQREAVDAVIDEFFTLGDDGWHQKRCDEEIAELRELEASSGERRANEAERQRRHRERRKELFAALREHDIVPRYDASTESLEAMLSRVTGGGSHGQVTRDSDGESRTRHALATANQTPDTRHQTPDEEQDSPSTTGQAPGVGNPAGRLAAALNRAGIRVTSQDPRLIEAATAGITAAEVVELRDLYPDKPAAYLLKAAASQRAISASGDTHAAQPQGRRLSAVERVNRNVQAARERDAAGDSGVLEGEAVRLAR